MSGLSVAESDLTVGAKPTFSAIAQSRAMTVFASLFYAYAIHYSHLEYLNPAWQYYGFTYRQPGVVELLLMFGLLLLGSSLIPVALRKPSSIVVVLLYVVVYVPTVVVTLSLDTTRIRLYGPSLIMLGVAFAIACLGARYRSGEPSVRAKIPNDVFCMIVLGMWVVCCAILIANYRAVMGFASLADIYEQRAAGAATSLFMGYVQTYFSNVLSPALIALGLVKRRRWFVLAGCAGCVIMYMINAQRTVLVLPVAIMAVHFALTRKSTLFRTSSFLLFLLGTAAMVSVAYYEDSAVASFVALLLVFRTLGLPGLTFSQYHDLFSGSGFTFWSHVRGLGALIPAPSSYVSDSLWPGLGYMVGDRVYSDVKHNVVANLFSGDGVAAAGAVGVGLIGLIFAIWLSYFDRASRGWDSVFAVLVTLPLALSLTNGHFFTTLLSFGGIFWMVIFYLYKPGGRPARRAETS